jgi:hypothetical protein
LRSFLPIYILQHWLRMNACVYIRLS